MLTVVVDENYLNDVTTTYPIYIDPTITIGRSSINDATVYSGKPDRQAGLIEKDLYAGNDFLKGFGTERFLIKAPSFVSALNTCYISSDNIIQSKLRLFNDSSANSPSTISVFMFGQQWSEESVSYSSVNWNGYTRYQDQANVTNYVGYYWWDITEATKVWKTGEYNYGLLLRAEDEFILGKEHAFHASDSADESVRPFIEVTFNTPPVVDQELIPRYGKMWCWNAAGEMASRSIYSVADGKNQDGAFKAAYPGIAIDGGMGGEAGHINSVVDYFTDGHVKCSWWGTFQNGDLYK